MSLETYKKLDKLCSIQDIQIRALAEALRTAMCRIDVLEGKLEHAEECNTTRIKRTSESMHRYVRHKIEKLTAEFKGEVE